MISRIIALSIRNKLLVALLIVGLVAWGGYSAVNLPLDAIPDATNNQVQVITQSPALAAQEVEQLLTVPLELQLRTIPGSSEVRSISRFGLSVITVVFDDEIDTYRARQLVAEKLKVAEADLGAGLGIPQMAPITTGLGEIYQYTLDVDAAHRGQYSLAALRDVQDWIVRRQLAGVPGVVDVSSFGGYVRQYEVSVDPGRLAAAGVTLPELFDALQQNNANTGGAYLERGPSTYFIRGEGRATSLADIGAIAIKRAGATPLLVRDVAEVRFGHAVRYGALTCDAKGETVGGIVLMLKGASSEQTIKGVKARVAAIQQTLPPGVRVVPFLDRTKLIDKAIHTVSRNLLEGGLIVIGVLLLLLGNLRAGLVVASMIPLCMLFALGLMRTFGVSANLMSLGALDFGLIVDGAVIIVEVMIFHLVHERLLPAQPLPLAAEGPALEKAGAEPQPAAAHMGFSPGQPTETMDDVARHAATRLMRSALFGQLIILIVYLPILALTGIEGKMFRPMALTVVFAIGGAMLLCLTYVPAVAAWALRKDMREWAFADNLMQWLHRGYEPIIRGALRFRWAVLGTAGGLFLLVIFLFTRMGGEFIPQLDEGDFAVEFALKPGSSLTQNIALSQRAQRILLEKFPEVETVIGKIGTSEIPTDPMPLEATDLIIVLKDRAEWTSAHSREELADKMAQALEAIPGVSADFQQPIQMRFNELVSGVKSDVAVKIYGEDLDVLYEKANEAAALIRPLAGVGDLKVEQIVGLPQLRVTYDRQKLAQYGLRVADLNALLRTSFAGDVAGQVYEGERRYDLVVRLDSAHRQGIDDLSNLYVDLPGGGKVPLAEVATVAYRNAPTQISRDDARRRINIGINVRNRDVESLVADIQAQLTAKLKLPPGYAVVYGGQFENLQQAKSRLQIAVPVALVLIFLLLYLSFSSVQQAALIFTGIPLAAIGGVLALWLRGMPFSISAGVGFIALFGVAVLNGIVLVASLNELAAAGVADVRTRVLRATSERFRPVLLTASVAALGFLPMALSTSAGAEVQKPLATVVIGGLISATLLTLVVLPVLYAMVVRGPDAARASARDSDGNTDERSAESGDGLRTKVRSTLLLLLALPLGLNAQAPVPLTLPQALQSGLSQNLLLQAGNLDVERQRALTRTGFDVPRTLVDFQFGQISGPLADRSFNVIQQFGLPGVYTAQRQLLREQAITTEQRTKLQRRELTRQIRETYYQLLLTHRHAALLRRQDSLYRRATRAAEVRYRTGETNRLEQVSAEARAREVRNRLLTVLTDAGAQQIQLGALLGLNAPVPIDTTADVVAGLTAADTAALSPETNPTLALLRQEVTVSRQQTRVEELRRLPDVRVGYFNQTINRERSFNVAQAGISVPLLGGVQRARINAAKIGERQAETQLAWTGQQLHGQLGGLRQQLRRARASLDYYQTSALPQARLILTTAEKSFRAGDIDYVTYVVQTEPAWQIQEAYLEAVRRYDDLVISTLYLTGAND